LRIDTAVAMVISTEDAAPKLTIERREVIVGIVRSGLPHEVQQTLRRQIARFDEAIDESREIDSQRHRDDIGPLLSAHSNPRTTASVGPPCGPST
jgi:pyrimidine operon attenuation protein/uracil phosphoribosyltransferase